MAEDYSDPRTQIAHELEAGQIYEDNRSDDNKEQLTLLYIDEQVALLRSNFTVNRDNRNHHRLNTRREFEENVGSGRLTLTDETADVGSQHLSTGEEVAFTNVKGIGQGTADNLREAGIVTDNDVAAASDAELLNVGGMGETTVERLREMVDNE